MNNPRRLADPSEGDWLAQRLLEQEPRVVRTGSVVPTGFERVVRVLHPLGDENGTWAEVAEANHKTMHPLVQWGSIAPHFDGIGRGGDEDPEEGSTPAPTMSAILQHCPAQDEVVYGVWYGWGTWPQDDNDDPLMATWGRYYRLFAANKDAHTEWPGDGPSGGGRCANLTWPRDRSWCIAAEIDWDSTLVACSNEVADHLLADTRLETFEVGYHDDLSWYGDLINPHPAWLPIRADDT